MIRVEKIYSAGGACPYQLEGLTDSGEWFYLRYRGGRLRCGVWKSEHYFMTNDCNYNLFDKVIGDRLDGFPDHETFMKHLKDIIIFPEGFEFRQEYFGDGY
jgi:hypothetical protein